MIPFILAALGGGLIANALSKGKDKLSEGGVIVNEDGVSTDATGGGIFKGKRHSEGGIAVDVIGGSPVEVETDEALIKDGKANRTEKVTFDGKEMTPREVLSTINQDYGGVPIKKKGGALDAENIVSKVNKDKEPVVVEGGSIVITRNAILDDETKHDFNGKMLTNKEILSEINKMNGGKEFAEGGNIYSDGTEIPNDIYEILKEKRLLQGKCSIIGSELNKLAREDGADLRAGLISERLRLSERWQYLIKEYQKELKKAKDFLSSEKGKKCTKYMRKLDRAKQFELLHMKFAEGGGIPNNYVGKDAKEVWNKWTLEQRANFLKDHWWAKPESLLSSKIKDIEKGTYEELPAAVKQELSNHVKHGEYKGGGDIPDKIAKVLIISSKSTLSSQLQKETGDTWNAIDYDDESVDKYVNVVRHKKSGKTFIVFTENYYSQVDKDVIKDDLSYIVKNKIFGIEGYKFADGRKLAEGGTIDGLNAYEFAYLYVKKGIKQPYRQDYLKPIGLWNTEKAKEVEKSLISKGYLNNAGAITESGKSIAKKIDLSIEYGFSGGYLGTMSNNRVASFKSNVESQFVTDKMSDGGRVGEYELSDWIKEERYLTPEDSERIEKEVTRKDIEKHRKLGTHEKFTKWWYNGGSEIAMKKYGDDNEIAWREAYEDFKNESVKEIGGKIDDIVVEIDKDDYFDMLNAVPPIYIQELNGTTVRGFALGEAYSHITLENGKGVATYKAYLRANGKFYKVKELVYFIKDGVAKTVSDKNFKEGGTTESKDVCIRSKGKGDFKTWHILNACSPYSYSCEVDFDTEDKAEKFAISKGWTVVKEFDEGTDYEIVVVYKELQKDGGKRHSDRYLVNADSVEAAKDIASKMWEDTWSYSDLTFVEALTDEEYREKYLSKGGKTWIQDAVKNKGALRETAKRKGLIKGDEKLSMTDIKKLEKVGGKTAKRAHLAETLAKVRKHNPHQDKLKKVMAHAKATRKDGEVWKQAVARAWKEVE